MTHGDSDTFVCKPIPAALKCLLVYSPWGTTTRRRFTLRGQRKRHRLRRRLRSYTALLSLCRHTNNIDGIRFYSYIVFNYQYLSVRTFTQHDTCRLWYPSGTRYEWKINFICGISQKQAERLLDESPWIKMIGWVGQYVIREGGAYITSTCWPITIGPRL